MPLAHSTPRAFTEDFDATARQLRAALTELLTGLGTPPDQPQAISRRFGLQKNLAWKLARIVSAVDSIDIAPVVPGAGGMRLALESFARAGASDPSVAAVRAAAEEFDRMTRLHAGDRDNLELMLTSMLPERIDKERLERSRRLAFLGNSTILGLQAGTSFSTTILSPNALDPDRIDFALLRGAIGFRRLRPMVRGPLATIRSYGLDDAIVPIDGEIAEGEAPLLREFCSDTAPPIHSVRRKEEVLFELGEGPVGNTASFSCVFGWTMPAAAPLRTDDSEEVGEHFFRLDLPTERAQFDLLIHRDLPFPAVPRPFIYNLMPGQVQYPLSRQERYLLPCPAQVQNLGDSPVVTTQFIPDYRAMIDRVCEGIGQSPGDYRGYRLELTYPPIPSFLVLAHPLASQL